MGDKTISIDITQPDGTPVESEYLQVRYQAGEQRVDRAIRIQDGTVSADVPDDAVNIQITPPVGYDGSPRVIVIKRTADADSKPYQLKVWKVFAIRGRVTDAEDKPLTNIEVTLTGEWQPGKHRNVQGVDSKGNYRFVDVQAYREYVVSAANPGYEAVGPGEITLTVDQDKTGVDFKLKKQPGYTNVEAALIGVFGSAVGGFLAMAAWQVGVRLFGKKLPALTRTEAGAREVVNELPARDVIQEARGADNLDSGPLRYVEDQIGDRSLGDLDGNDLVMDVLKSDVSQSPDLSAAEDVIDAVDSFDTESADLVNLLQYLRGLDSDGFELAVKNLTLREYQFMLDKVPWRAVGNPADEGTADAISSVFSESGISVDSSEALLENGGFAVDTEEFVNMFEGVVESDSAMVEVIVDFFAFSVGG